MEKYAVKYLLPWSQVKYRTIEYLPLILRSTLKCFKT